MDYELADAYISLQFHIKNIPALIRHQKGKGCTFIIVPFAFLHCSIRKSVNSEIRKSISETLPAVLK
jgi:hypothetical protein